MVRLITNKGENRGIVRISKALQFAQELKLDLVQMNSDAPPVCKVMNYGKHLFNKKKSHRSGYRTMLKEIKFRVGTDDADYNVKLRKLRQFLEDGNKAKISLRFRGREASHQERGLAIMRRVSDDLRDWGKIEQDVELDRMELSMVIAPTAIRRSKPPNNSQS